MEEDMELKVGENIAKYRKVMGYTQEQLGDLVGVSGQAVSKWENGGTPDAYLLPTISKVLDVSIDALFGLENNLSVRSRNEVLDDIFKLCSNMSCEENGDLNFIHFLFETVWTLQDAYCGDATRISFHDIVDLNRGTPQVTSQILTNDGTTYLSLSEEFPIFYAIRDSSTISKQLLSENNFEEFFSLLASKDGLKVVIFTQSVMDRFQYTEEMIAEKAGVSVDGFRNVEPLLVKYGLLTTDSLLLDGKNFTVYRVRSTPEIRPILMTTYQFINAKNHYYHYICNRSKQYFEM